MRLLEDTVETPLISKQSVVHRLQKRTTVSLYIQAPPHLKFFQDEKIPRQRNKVFLEETACSTEVAEEE